MRAPEAKQIPRRSVLARRVIVAVWIGACIGSVGTPTRSHAQGSNSQLLPPSREEIADEERQSWTLRKFPSQPYMSEFYWRFPSDTPAFFREFLLQFVARTYYLTRDNFDGSRSQAWTGGGWIAFRSGLIADVFGVHAAYYTSQPIFAPSDEGGTRLLNPNQDFARHAWSDLWAYPDSSIRKFAAVDNWWIPPSSIHKTIAWCQTRLRAPRWSRSRTRIETMTTRSVISGT